ncbi:tyrosine-type recombinase/integrase [Mycobacteroides abscessus]|uniref:tyrosine-type recombinase/integrase n=1 Tax=Mycobacteroides abscessus TaxID=36809 RepID=UPI0009A63EB1|nr:site-specific integrase [Mycobacteroides abscessus]SLG36758.1 phage integrase family protein [Mycobacteroides abscessus subsp. massiliense]
MAYIRKRETKAKAKGRPVVSYAVCWREPVRDEFGAIVPGKTVQRTETFPLEKEAKERLRALETELATAHGTDPSAAKAKANRPLGEYARQYLDSLAGTIDDNTIEGYEKLYRTHIGPLFGSKPVAAITTADVMRFRADLLAPYQRRHGRAKPDTPIPANQPLVTRSPKTVKHIVGTLKRILDVAVGDQAIAGNPVVPGRRHTTKRRTRAAGDKAPFKHRPLTANQVASVYDWIANDREVVRETDNSSGPNGSTYVRPGNAVYALAVLFAAHTGIRASELQGLQLQDITLSTLPATVGSVRIVRTAARKDRVWTYGTPKSESSSDRVVPLAPWLADELREYLTTVHPFSATNKAGNQYAPNAPLFPGRRNRYVFDWAKPVCAASLYEHYLQPATKALGLGAVRFHDLRHTFATMNLSTGEHYMQVSKWLGHSTFVLTLTTYADYINEDEMAAPKVGRGAADTGKVVQLQRKAN